MYRRYRKGHVQYHNDEDKVLLMENPDIDDNEEKINTTVDNNDLEVKTYTVEEAVDYSGFGIYQFKLIVMIGLLSASDAMEMLLLSILGPALQCEWHLSFEKKALITTIVFIGFLLGSFFWGMVSDNYGRKTTFLIVISIISYMGFFTAFSPNYIWVIVLRGCVGFGIGGAASSFTLLSEFLPSSRRAKVLIIYQVWWAMGSTFEVGLAYFVLPRYGWRWVVGLTAIPMMLCAILILFLPESPRFLLNQGKHDQAQRIINRMFQTNKKPILPGTLSSSVKQKPKFNLQNLFYKEYRCTFFLLLMIWFGVTFSYYGIVLLNAEYFNFHNQCFKEKTTLSIATRGNYTFVDDSCCQSLDGDDYKSMLISSFGEFFIIPINFFLVDFIGRTKTMSMQFLFAAILFFLLWICMPQFWSTFLMFGIRGLTSGIFNVAYIYTSEVFPTSVRSSATGMCSSFARIAAIITPFIAQVLIPKYSLFTGLIVYSSLTGFCCICSFCLPIETKGRPMPQNFQEIEIEMVDK